MTCSNKCFDEVRKKMKKIKNLNLELTDAKSVDSSVDGLLAAFISPDGQNIYQVNAAAGPVSAGVPAAQFAKNVEGKIVYTISIPSDATFINVDDGAPNPSFTRFTLLDDNGAGTGRIRVFDANGNVVGTRLFTDLANPGVFAASTFEGGLWSADGKYIVIYYTLNTSVIGATNSIIRVLRADTFDLPIVASFNVTGFSQDPQWFSLPLSSNKKNKKKCDFSCPLDASPFGRYFIVFAPGDIDVESTIAGAGCPNSLRVLEFTGSSLIQIAQAPLPSFALGYKAWPSTPCEIKKATEFFDKQDAELLKQDEKKDEKEYKCERDEKTRERKPLKQRYALISVNTTVSIGANQVSPFVIDLPSCIGNDAKELRLYAFDGEHLIFLNALDTQLRGSGVTFSPDGRFLLAEEGVRNLLITRGAAAQFSSTMNIFKVPLDDIYEFFVNTYSNPKLRSKFCPTSADGVPKNIVCLKQIRNIGGFPNSFFLSFSMNSEWFIVAGPGVFGGPSSGSDIFPVQLYRVISSKC